MLADIAYVGNIQRHQPIQFNLNAVPLGTAFLPQFATPGNAGYNFFGPVTASNPGALPGSNAEDPSVMRPYPGYNSLTMNENGANVHYNSLQATLAKRFGHGLSFQAAYTLAQTKGQTENIGLFNYNWQQYTGYQLSNDRSQVLSINYTYDIPKIAGLVHMDNRFGREVFNGWRLAHLITFFSGSPYSPSFSVQQSNTTTAVSLGNVFLGTPDLTPRLGINGNVNTAGSNGAIYFNPSNLTVHGAWDLSQRRWHGRAQFHQRPGQRRQRYQRCEVDSHHRKARLRVARHGLQCLQSGAPAGHQQLDPVQG
jgi:hypothetical protein